VPLHDRPLAQRGGDRGGLEDEVGDRGAPQGRQGPWPEGLLVLEEGETPGLPRDLHHQQRRQGAGGALNLRSVEAFLKF